MVDLMGRFTRPSRRAARPGTVADALRVPAVRREPASAEAGELVLTQGSRGGPMTIQWQRPGCPAITLAPPYRLDRVDLKGSYRARLHGLTAGVRLVCPDWSPLFLVAPAQLAVLACAAATTRTPPAA
ncbi:hypothetical protein OG871_22095 [Kitasatospora sp. NBC_00374]|uniref:hypothetical protein n=1 Tax=Kitasatospora sp. NBC_00374 TaxID=2975964 RepID=UPI0032453126